MSDSTRYPAQLFWSEEDKAFIAVASDLPGCSAVGDTQESAIAELQCAIEAWIEATIAAGNHVPQPSTPGEHSGKVLLRMPVSLHADLVRRSRAERVSLNQYLVYLLTSASTIRAAMDAPRIPEQTLLRNVRLETGYWHLTTSGASSFVQAHDDKASAISIGGGGSHVTRGGTMSFGMSAAEMLKDRPQRPFPKVSRS